MIFHQSDGTNGILSYHSSLSSNSIVVFTSTTYSSSDESDAISYPVVLLDGTTYSFSPDTVTATYLPIGSVTEILTSLITQDDVSLIYNFNDCPLSI